MVDVIGKLRYMASRGLFEGIPLPRISQPDSSPFSFFPSLLKASPLPFALQLHAFLLKTSIHRHTVSSNSLLALYSKHSHARAARLVFDEMPPSTRDSVTWSSIVMSYVRDRDLPTSVHMLSSMLCSCFGPPSQLLAGVVSLCGKAGDLRLGLQLHAHSICSGKSELCPLLSTALVDMYSRCRDLRSACRVFEEMKMDERNEVSWTAIIAGCVANGNCSMSLGVFRAMQVRGVKPNRVTLVSVLPACAELGALRLGKEIHAHVLRHGYVSETRLDGALIDMYCKCHEQSSAELVFERAETADVVMWSSMIGGCSRSGDAVKAIELFHQMQMKGVRPNSVTLLAVVGACSGLSSADWSHTIHGYAVKSGLNLQVFVGNSLIDTYAKCGCFEASRQVFEEMPVRDHVSWSALISAYGGHGRGAEALQIFCMMLEKGIEADQITLLAVLSACNHAGLVEQGLELFDHVIGAHGLAPIVEHYACLVDLLGRAGRLEDACDVVKCMPMRPSFSMWGSLVCACRVHGRFDLAQTLAQQLIDSEPENAGNYTLLSTVYAESGNWDGIEEVRLLMKERRLKKRFGCSRIDIGSGGSVAISYDKSALMHGSVLPMSVLKKG